MSMFSLYYWLSLLDQRLWLTNTVCEELIKYQRKYIQMSLSHWKQTIWSIKKEITKVPQKHRVRKYAFMTWNWPLARLNISFRWSKNNFQPWPMICVLQEQRGYLINLSGKKHMLSKHLQDLTKVPLLQDIPHQTCHGTIHWIKTLKGHYVS